MIVSQMLYLTRLAEQITSLERQPALLPARAQ